jgi:Mn2+/Fe2+ NRAMP family transporter
LIATLITLGNSHINLFSIAVITQTVNAIALPPVFYYLIKLTSDRSLMGEFTNSGFQKWFSIICTVFIVLASIGTVLATFIH